MTEYEWMLRRFQASWGYKFDPSGLCQKFVPYYNSDQRIKVQMWEDEPGYTDGIMCGTVATTSGWRPSFMLMEKSTSRWSPWLLDDKCKILAVKVGSKYMELQEAI